MPDYVCLIHAFCWLNTISVRHSAIALHCRAALRNFWIAPRDAEFSDFGYQAPPNVSGGGDRKPETVLLKTSVVETGRTVSPEGEG